MLRSVRRQTISDADSNFFIRVGYHSAPYSIPCVPFVSEERKIFKIPALALLTITLNASANSASWLSWLTKINDVFVRTDICSSLGGGCSTLFFGTNFQLLCTSYNHILNIRLM